MNLRGILAGTALASSLSLGGCASSLSEFTEGEGMTLIGALMGESGDSQARKLAPYVSLLGQMRYQKEVIREGRTQINIQGGQTQRTPENVIYSEGNYFPAPGFTWTDPENPNDLNLRKSIGVVFAANYWRDFNNNGLVDPNEYIGIKNRFYENEEMILVLYSPESQEIEREINWDVYGPKGEFVLGGSRTNGMGANQIGGEASFLIEKEGYGNYVVVWRSLGLTETKQFEIVPSPNPITRNFGKAITLNHWRDINDNRSAELEELIGMKDSFYGDENIFLALHGFEGLTTLYWEVEGPTGEKVEGIVAGERVWKDVDRQSYAEGYRATNMASVNESYRKANIDNFASWLRWSAGEGNYIGEDERIPRTWQENPLHFWDAEEEVRDAWENVRYEDIEGGYGSYVVTWRALGVTKTKQFEIVPSSTRK
ncbi:MAG TPA: hypothetical protein ENI22_00200 [Candidatus Pacearchaeota archaeon]|nr:hypothetical protein [Candidatus Pacearchaeota archaeon]